MTKPQQELFFKTRGVCRFVYNLFISQNLAFYKEKRPYLSAREFSVWLNNTYLVQNPEKLWIKDVSSKAVKRSLEDANLAYRRFLTGQTEFPRFKRKK